MIWFSTWVILHGTLLRGKWTSFYILLIIDQVTADSYLMQVYAIQLSLQSRIIPSSAVSNGTTCEVYQPRSYQPSILKSTPVTTTTSLVSKTWQNMRRSKRSRGMWTRWRRRRILWPGVSGLDLRSERMVLGRKWMRSVEAMMIVAPWPLSSDFF